ncbi:MAG: phospho-N-acetylmuramoyl-pentapeptide-transferase [Alphaproteobacteria bacterium GM7ARS4]|nr:phospho-N-acetylmuramoyl-pentapeptide-transferase [Alphaproteobacteria bacterium GM7ARS4]
MFHALLTPLSSVFGPFNLFHYISVRCFGALLTSLLICFVIGPHVIGWLKRHQGYGQPIRDDGPVRHVLTKRGTPTMGGSMILLSTLPSVLLWVDVSNLYVWITIGVMLAFACIGGMDDYHKIKQLSHRGLRGRTRLLLESAVVVAAAFVLYSYTDYSSELLFPFFKDISLDIGLWSIPFMVLVITGSANGVNLTDGLDGLAIVPLMFCLACFLVIAWVVGNVVLSSYLQLTYVAESGELAVLCAAMIGACLGFLWYNAPPAMVFMGDMGALSLGSALGCIAVIAKHEFVLVIVGGVFVLETVSVIVQVLSYKLTGRRVFLMAPLHHHYEQKGWQEATIVIRFWIISAILTLLGLASLKIR